MSDTKLDNFQGLDIKLEFKSPIDKYSKQCENILRQTSPDGKRTKKEYKDGWTIELTEKGNDVYSAVVWNRTGWQLTHLLENGHLIVNKRNGVGWASAKPHINATFERLKEPFLQEMKQVNINIK